ncbi:hypothetical protein EV189_2935 [Motilibacter rhizosphaerae]|uniref:Pyridinium-3,5-bisthiocarboxylic acid mononucleotide nickel insertion protein n=1 Tax=Motilibacter rhizosphaerae TaxID=598652 RepID=A0A4Q7NQ92_9ACTN|nr:nickel pincer cofactor biosynthesis protein LarC [Motilibacter rhizosphaerae]RZS87504.1 hypothetical protein EV189_2935 [Motilibacter rhizosphaerae]
MSTLWLDVSVGASGDMLLGALLGAGASLDAVQRAVAALDVEPVRIGVEQVTRAGLVATRAVVDCPPSAHRRTWPDVQLLLASADLDAAVRGAALRTFALLAEAEAAVHGVPVDDVHFHEVGALDSLADVVGVSAAIHDLAPSSVVATPVGVGSGSVRTAHGALPVPVPAVLQIAAQHGLPVESGPGAGEMCTPTGAALLSAYVTAWGGLPAGVVRGTGAGAGGKEVPGVANVVRAVVLDGTSAGTLVQLEANVDDLDPRVWPYVLARLLDAGALDAWLVPIVMKKGRPAHTLAVLCAESHADALQRLVFVETTTLGVRRLLVSRTALERDVTEVSVDGQSVRVKRGWLDGEVVTATPEYADAEAAARATGLPLREVLARALRGQ